MRPETQRNVNQKGWNGRLLGTPSGTVSKQRDVQRRKFFETVGENAEASR